MLQDHTNNPLTDVGPVTADFLPIFRRFAIGEYAVTIGGSFGRGCFDAHSDIDFRLYAEAFSVSGREMVDAIRQPMADWEARGIRVDGVWPRTIGDIDAALARWLDGHTEPEDKVWTVWGYHLLPDLLYQRAVEDPFDIVAGWKRRLDPYPPALQDAIVTKNLHSLRYWRDDYHYENKLHRGDRVFLAGLTVRLVHEIVQVLFALNEVYYVGDGQNLELIAQFEHKPRDVERRITDILYPLPLERTLEEQRDALLSLITEVEQLADPLIAGRDGDQESDKGSV